MSNFGNNGSVTFQKRRYNDDFGLNFKGLTKNTYIYTEETFQEISNLTDWSLSFFVSVSDSLLTSNTTIAYLGSITNTTRNASALYLKKVGANDISLTFDVYESGNTNYFSYVFPLKFKLGATAVLKNITITFDSVSKILSVFVDSIFIQSLVIQNINFQNNSHLSSFGSPVQNSLKANFSIFDIVTFNRILLEQEIINIYQKRDFPNQGRVNYFPLNQLPFLNQSVSNFYYKTVLTSANDAGVLFADELIGDGNIEFTILSKYARCVVGFSTASTMPDPSPVVTPQVGVLVFGQAAPASNLRTVVNGTSGTTIGIQDANMTIKLERIGTTLRIYINNVLSPTTLTISNGIVRPYLAIFHGGETSGVSNFSIKDLKMNGTVIYNVITATNIETKNFFITSQNNNIKKTFLCNFTESEVGLLNPVSSFTAYSDFYTKEAGANFSGSGDSIIYKLKELRYYGLTFNGINQYLEHPNFNPTKEKGYTFIVFYANKTNSVWGSNQSIFSKYGTDGTSRQFDLQTDSIDERVNLLVPISPTGTLGLSSYQTGVDNSKPQMASYVISPTQNVPMPYEKLGNTKYFGYETYNAENDYVNQLNLIAGVGFGFDEITAGVTRIGQKNGANFFNGHLLCLMVFKGIANQEFVKRRFNNGLINLPSDFECESNGLEFVLCPDFQNPFDDAGTLKIPDLITPEDWTAFNFTNLPTLQASRPIINSLR